MQGTQTDVDGEQSDGEQTDCSAGYGENEEWEDLVQDWEAQSMPTEFEPANANAPAATVDAAQVAEHNRVQDALDKADEEREAQFARIGESCKQAKAALHRTEIPGSRQSDKR